MLETNKMVSCPGLASSLWACTKQCTSKLDDGCGDAMIKTLECNLVNEFVCAGHSCPKPSFGLTGKGFGAICANLFLKHEKRTMRINIRSVQYSWS